MAKLLSHSHIDFILKPEETPAVLQWVAKAKDFFAEKLKETANVGILQNQFSYDIEEALEDSSVHFCAQFATCLSTKDINVEACQMLVSFACILEPSLKVHSPSIQTGFEAQQQIGDAHGSVDGLFQAIGKAIRRMSVALVAQLEGGYYHPSSIIQEISLAAASRITLENRDLFVEVDNLTAVWNLFFLLEMPSVQPLPTQQQVHPQLASLNSIATNFKRVAIFKSLQMLAAVYVPADCSLTFRIMTAFLTLPVKTQTEISAIQAAIFEILCELRVQNISDPVEYPYGSILNVFSNLLTAKAESHYDLLHWCVGQTAVLFGIGKEHFACKTRPLGERGEAASSPSSPTSQQGTGSVVQQSGSRQTLSPGRHF
eukprot:GCRY01006100.1.p1 GENE.GCRY01006100.1~~GCRY01006100.1.p1  ORF type:complete len:372 (-),score=84.44 GCRY01006100.1:8-1123(-)